VASASSAVTTLNSYVEQLGAQKALLGSNLSELELSIDRLGQQVFAGKVSLDRMTDEEMAEDLIRLSRDEILSQGNIALMTQARGINQNLVDTLL
jgi:flagellin